MVKCADCDFWYRKHGGEGECRNKKSAQWKKTTIYCESCENSKQITLPLTLSSYVKCKAGEV